jgi:uncharacterized protein YgfB (UPF0149 family)
MSTTDTTTKGNDMAIETSTETRTSEQGNTFDAATIRGFLLATLSQDAVIDGLNDLLFEHVKEGRYHPSVIATSLRPMIDEILEVAENEDWQFVANTLIAQAREMLADDDESAR